MSGPADIAVVVVCPPRTLLLDVAGPVEVLRKANLIQDRVRFRVSHVGPHPEVTSSTGLGLAGLATLPEPLPEGATVVLAGTAKLVLGDPSPPGERERAAEEAIVAWLRAQVRPGHRLVSICSGALLAARAGLLDGHACTTHHADCATLAALAPTARVLEDRLFVEDRERLTSAGITAGIDLMLHLVARVVDPACAAAVARYLVVYLRRSGHDPQLSPWLEGRNHLHPAIHRVQDAVSADPARAWSLEALADIAATSPRHLSRLFNRHAGMSLPGYINGLRVALARDLLAQTRLDMERVAERAGFASPRQLRRAWSRVNDGPPSAMREGCRIRRATRPGRARAPSPPRSGRGARTG